MKGLTVTGMIFLLMISSFGCAKKTEPSKLLHLFEPGEYSVGLFSRNLRYRIHVPKQEAKGAKLPLVLYLHSGVSGGRDNTKQIETGAETFANQKLQEKHPCYVLAPQCPRGRQWLNTAFEKMPFTNYDQASIPESHEMKMVARLVEQLISIHDIDPNRIYVTGFSMGASGTWDIIARYPDRFAAAIPLSGVSDPKQAEKLSHLPIWAFHGAEDKVSRVENTRNMIAALKKHGSTCRYTEYPDAGHDVTMAYASAELIEWLFDQSWN
jgi:predicted peptidase